MSAHQIGALFLILLGYLSGSVSFAYLAGRLRKIDLRQYGGGKLSGSNVYHQVGLGGMVLVGILDIAKAAAPSWLCLKLGYALWVTVLAGRLAPHAAAVPALAGFVGLPLFAIGSRQPEATVWGCWGMLALVVLKRLEGNRRPIAGDTWRVLLRRLTLDRDIADFETWIGQRPGAEV